MFADFAEAAVAGEVLFLVFDNFGCAFGDGGFLSAGERVHVRSFKFCCGLNSAPTHANRYGRGFIFVEIRMEVSARKDGDCVLTTRVVV